MNTERIRGRGETLLKDKKSKSAFRFGPSSKNGEKEQNTLPVKLGFSPSENIPAGWKCLTIYNNAIFGMSVPKNTKELWNTIIGRPQHTPERIDRIFRQGIKSITKLERENVIDRHQREAMVRIVTEHYLTVRIYDYLKDSPFGFIISPSK